MNDGNLLFGPFGDVLTGASSPAIVAVSNTILGTSGALGVSAAAGDQLGIAVQLVNNNQAASSPQAEQVEETQTIDTGALAALVEISLFEVEGDSANVATLVTWDQREDLPGEDATEDEWAEFIEKVLETYPEEQRAEVRERILKYRESLATDATADADYPELEEAVGGLNFGHLASTSTPWARGGVGFETHYWN